jgi:glycogen operon protein
MLFTGKLLAFRRAHPAFRRRRWFQDRPLHGQDIRDVVWLTPAGKEMSDEDWSVGVAKSLMVFLNGKAIPSRGQRGEATVDDSFFLCFNAHYEPMPFTVPQGFGQRWKRVIDTADPYLTQPIADAHAGVSLTLESRSMMVLQQIE